MIDRDDRENEPFSLVCVGTERRHYVGDGDALRIYRFLVYVFWDRPENTVRGRYGHGYGMTSTSAMMMMSDVNTGHGVTPERVTSV